MTKNIEICKAEEVGAQVLDIRTTAERQAVAAINAAFGLAIPLPANEPGEITELPAAVSAHDRQLLAQLLGKPEPAATLSTTDPLATFVATLTRDLYRHLADRQAVYPLADFPDPFARNIAHLLQAVQSLSPRKISNGSATNDGIPDGISLARLLCADYADVVELKDDTHGWTYSRNSLAQFPNAKKVTLGCKTATVNIVSNNSVIEELNIEELETVPTSNGSNLFNALTKLKHFRAPKLKQLSSGQSTNLSGLTECEDIDMPEMTSMWNGYGAYYMCNNPALKWVNIPKFDTTQNVTGQAILCNNPELERVKMGKLIQFSMRSNLGNEVFYNCPKLVDVEIGADTAISLYLAAWNPTDKGTTFLQNFRDHIALRLTDQGSGLTLTLSQAVRNAIHAAESTYGIEDIIVNQKHWTLSPAPSA